MKRGFSPERLLPFAAFAGAALLFASQFMSIFELKSAGGVVQATISAADQHWFSMAMFALLAAVSIFGAIWTGSRPLAVTVAVCGLVALLLFLLIDLPDAGRTDSVSTSAEALVVAEAHPAGGFWIELIGALVLTVCGAAMATLTSEQLRALRPGGRQEAPTARQRAKGRTSEPKGKDKPRAESEAASQASRKEKETSEEKEPRDGLSDEEIREKRRVEREKRRAARQAREA